jgi:signal peptidase I
MKFEQILVIATLIAGIIWLMDALLFAKKRRTISKTKDPIIVEYAKAFFPVLFLVLILRSFLVEPFRIPSGSMKPTLLEGDLIVVNKFSYGIRLPITGTKLIAIGNPKRGDIIVFRHFDNKDLIKRVVGLPGDRIQYIDGNLYINGKQIENQSLGSVLDLDVNGIRSKLIEKTEQLDGIKHQIYLNPLVRENYKYSDIIIPQDSYFVMGDNRNHSQDSRYWGVVKDKQIIGKAFATWMSWDSNYFDVRWYRVGKFIQ